MTEPKLAEDKKSTARVQEPVKKKTRIQGAASEKQRLMLVTIFDVVNCSFLNNFMSSLTDLLVVLFWESSQGRWYPRRHLPGPRKFRLLSVHLGPFPRKIETNIVRRRFSAL